MGKDNASGGGCKYSCYGGTAALSLQKKVISKIINTKEITMFVWKHSEVVNTKASASEIWIWWKDAANWPLWDKELKWVRLDGEFVEGATGKMKPTAGPEVHFTLDKVVVNQSFSNTAKLPFTQLVFNHEYLTPGKPGDTAKIRHTVTMTGLLTPLFGRVIGSKIRLNLREAMLELSKRATTSS